MDTAKEAGKYKKCPPPDPREARPEPHGPARGASGARTAGGRGRAPARYGDAADGFPEGGPQGQAPSGRKRLSLSERLEETRKRARGAFA